MDLELKEAVIVEIQEIEEILCDKPKLLKLFQELVLSKNVELAQFCFTSYSEEETEETEETEEWITTSESEDEEEFNYQNA